MQIPQQISLYDNDKNTSVSKDLNVPYVTEVHSRHIAVSNNIIMMN